MLKISQNYRFEKLFVFKIYRESGLDAMKRSDEKAEQNFKTRESLNIDDYLKENFGFHFLLPIFEGSAQPQECTLHKSAKLP